MSKGNSKEDARNTTEREHSLYERKKVGSQVCPLSRACSLIFNHTFASVLIKSKVAEDSVSFGIECYFTLNKIIIIMITSVQPVKVTTVKGEYFGHLKIGGGACFRGPV